MMAAKGGRIIFLWGNGFWWVAHALVDGLHTHVHMDCTNGVINNNGREIRNWEGDRA